MPEYVSWDYEARSKHGVIFLNSKPNKNWEGKDPDKDEIFPFIFMSAVSNIKYTIERSENSDGQTEMHLYANGEDIENTQLLAADFSLKDTAKKMFVVREDLLFNGKVIIYAFAPEPWTPLLLQ